MPSNAGPGRPPDRGTPRPSLQLGRLKMPRQLRRDLDRLRPIRHLQRMLDGFVLVGPHHLIQATVKVALDQDVSKAMVRQPAERVELRTSGLSVCVGRPTAPG
jgi:hypothetical protein